MKKASWWNLRKNITQKCKVLHQNKVHSSEILLEQTTNVLTLTSTVVPEYDSGWALMWTQFFPKYSRENSGAVPKLGYKVSTMYLATKWYNTVLCRCPGTSDSGIKCDYSLIRLASKWANLPHYLVLAVQPPMICRQERILKNREKGRLKLCNTVPQVRISKQVLFESQAKVTRLKEMSLDRLSVSMDMTSEWLSRRGSCCFRSNNVHRTEMMFSN